MKISFLLWLSLSLLCFPSSLRAQQKKTNNGGPDVKALQAEMEKIIKQGKKPDRAMLMQMAKQFGAKSSIKPNVAITASASNTFPKYNLAGLPMMAVTGKKLTDYVAKMMKGLEKKMDPEIIGIVDELERKTDTNSNLMSQVSWALYQMEADDAALLMAGRTVLKDPLNDLSTNNFAAMLTNAGAAPKAIPILKGLVPRNQKNPLMLNNIGQAYACVGMRDSALYYFVKCLMLQPKHVTANKTAAQISKANGNKTKAIAYAKNSVDGDASVEALEIIDELDPSPNKFDFLIKKDIPDYFNLYKFQKPTYQARHDQYEIVKAEQSAFKAEIDRMISQLKEIISQEEKLSAKAVNQSVDGTLNEAIATGNINKMLFSRLNKIAVKVYANKKINTDYPAEMRKIEEIFDNEIKARRSSYLTDIENISNQYKEKKAPYNCDEGSGNGCKMLERLTLEECDIKNKRLNSMLEACKVAAERFDQRQLQIARERFHFNSEWGYKLGVNEHMANALYYHAAVEYLKSIRKVVGYPPAEPFCLRLKEQLKTYTFADLTKPRCPTNTQFDIGVVTMKINCRESSIAIKLDKLLENSQIIKLSKKAAFWLDGVKLELKTDHIAKSSTISLIKTWLEQKIEVPELSTPLRWKAGAKVEVSTAIYVTMDGKGGDAGVKAKAAVSAWSGVASGSADALNQVEAGVEMGWGINSGGYIAPKGELINALN